MRNRIAIQNPTTARSLQRDRSTRTVRAKRPRREVSVRAIVANLKPQFPESSTFPEVRGFRSGDRHWTRSFHVYLFPIQFCNLLTGQRVHRLLPFLSARPFELSRLQ